MVQKVLGICEAKNWTKAHKLLHAGTDGHQRIWQNDLNNPNSRGRESQPKRQRTGESREKEKNYEKGVSEAVKHF